MDEQKVLLPFAQQVNALFVGSDYHIGEDLVALAFALDLVVLNRLHILTALPLFFGPESLGLDAELEVQLATRFQSFIAVVSVALDVLKKFVAGVAVGEKHVLYYFEPKYFLFQNGFIV